MNITNTGWLILSQAAWKVDRSRARLWAFNYSMSLTHQLIHSLFKCTVFQDLAEGSLVKFVQRSTSSLSHESWPRRLPYLHLQVSKLAHLLPDEQLPLLQPSIIRGEGGGEVAASPDQSWHHHQGSGHSIHYQL